MLIGATSELVDDYAKRKTDPKLKKKKRIQLKSKEVS